MSSTSDTSFSDSKHCYLLSIPLELQLSIYEIAVIKDGPLLLNCPCNSSYRGRGRYEQLQQDEEAWEKGEIHPPDQPAISLTCRSIRRVSLPIFYKENIFRASYCYQTMLLAPVKWLGMIGKENREMLRHLYFYDRNESHDRYHPKDLSAVQASAIFTEMDGRMETLSNQNCCAHLVSFGGYERRESRAPLAGQPGAAPLRMKGEE